MWKVSLPPFPSKLFFPQPSFNFLASTRTPSPASPPIIYDFSSFSRSISFASPKFELFPRYLLSSTSLRIIFLILYNSPFARTKIQTQWISEISSFFYHFIGLCEPQTFQSCSQSDSSENNQSFGPFRVAIPIQNC